MLSTRNALTSALVDWRVSLLDLQRIMGILRVDETGLWQEAAIETAKTAAAAVEMPKPVEPEPVAEETAPTEDAAPTEEAAAPEAGAEAADVAEEKPTEEATADPVAKAPADEAPTEKTAE